MLYNRKGYREGQCMRFGKRMSTVVSIGKYIVVTILILSVIYIVPYVAVSLTLISDAEKVKAFLSSVLFLVLIGTMMGVSVWIHGWIRKDTKQIALHVVKSFFVIF